MKKILSKYQVHITLATFITILIFIIGVSMNLASWKTAMEKEHQAIDVRQDHLTNGWESNKLSVDELEDRQSKTDVNMAMIETKLASIETLLIEIKQELKEAR